MFGCSHPNHTETTLADCRICPDFIAAAVGNGEEAIECIAGEEADLVGATTGTPANGRETSETHVQNNGAAKANGHTGAPMARPPARYAERLHGLPGLTTVGPQAMPRNGQPPPTGRRAAVNAKKLILKSFMCPGDLVMLTAAVRDLHLAYPGEFQTDVRTSVPALWENNPHLTQLEEGAAGVQPIDMHYDLVNQSNTAPYHFVHGYVRHLEQQLGLRIPVTRFHGDIHLAPIEKQWMSQVRELGFDRDFWIVMAGGKYDFTAKWWNPANYQNVIDHFQGRIQFVQCGEASHFHPPLAGAINLVGKTDARQFIRLMYHAAGVLCPVTYAMHLAAAVETKPGRPPHRACVVLAGGREPPHWEAYPHHQFISTVGALPCCAHGGCWRSRCQPVGDGDAKDGTLCERPVQVSPELRIAQCMEMITAEDVIRRIELYHEGGTLAYLNEQRSPG